MSKKPNTSQDPQAPKYGLLDLIVSNPVAGDSAEQTPSKKKEPGTSEFDNEDIQKKMNGVIHKIQTVPPDQDHKTKTNPARPASPLVGEQAAPPKRVTSPQLSKKDTNVLVVDDHKPKARKNSSASSSSEKRNKHKSTADKRKSPSRQHSPDRDEHKASSKSTGEKPSPTKQQQHQQPDSSHTKHEPTDPSKAKKHDRRASNSSDDSPARSSKQKTEQQKQPKHDSPSNADHGAVSSLIIDPKKLLHKERKRSSSGDSGNEHLNTSKVSHGNHSSQHDKSTQSKHDQPTQSKHDQPTQSKHDQPATSKKDDRPTQSKHDQPATSKKDDRPTHPTKPIRKSSDDEHSDDDKRPSQPKKKANDDGHGKTTKSTADYSKSSHNILDIVDRSMGTTAEPASHKSSGAPKPTSHPHHSTSRRSSTDEHKNAHDPFDDDDGHHKKPAHKTDPHSDTEHKKADKEPKRKRPKRISRTTQTHEYIFRRMEREQHEELLPAAATDKNIQTRQSQLRPRRKSPKKSNSIYMSSDRYKIEQIKPNKSSTDQHKGATNTEKSSAHNGKLLILRPTLPIHHSNAVKVERVNLQYAIDLVRDDSKRDKSPAGHRHKSNSRKHADHSHRFPRVVSSASSLSDSPKSKSADKKKDHRTSRRTADGAV